MRAGSALALTLVACANQGTSTPPAGSPDATSSGSSTTEPPSANVRSPACTKASAPSGVFVQHVPIFGKNRSYTLVVPPTYAPSTSYPIVYVLHGHGDTGRGARTAMSLEGVARDRAIFVYPDAPSGWDLDSPTSKNPDVALFDATLARTQSDYCIDLRRVFVTGFSNGAYMANQLGCRRGDRIRAIASHAGGGPYEVTGTYDEQGHLVCRGKAVGSLVVHGASDGTVSPAEGQKSIDHWTFSNHCTSSAPGSVDGCLTYQGCSNPVSVCVVRGLGHTLWPEARELTWSFFESQK